ncbi:adenylate/guanylate cyclase domain-containing protein [Aliifodinibius salicampi]|uniref:Adenylate/guanylate cyclase domain-containing protein n=1 Tax=Fodinibius salicampi TaxID=1920655 RepID=A0ABT3Q2L9_9BACT|nr:adenylate/guanylate cyclase domain-containing protein [Fodinibius salicampi]MCW9714341.1 adenylate/guanylate cyclase domain-containing protein [Fodinibius salicampi]
MDNAYQAEKEIATILFCDIRNFTSLLDSEDPLKAVKFANTVLAELGKEVENVGGRVDRFTGDGFMAHFGISDSLENHTESACRAALNMRDALQSINNKRYYEVESVVATGIGIHTGTVAYGKIETSQIKQETVLGDVVNTTSRIEELTKYFSVDILLSEQSYHLLKEEFVFQKMPAQQLRGKKKEMVTYWLLPMNLKKE